jgi:hypothetical protein
MEVMMKAVFAAWLAAGLLVSGAAFAQSGAQPVDQSAAVPPSDATAQRRADLDTAQAQRATHALNILEAQGMGSFTSFQPQGSNFLVTVQQGGQSYVFLVNPDTGTAQRQN